MKEVRKESITESIQGLWAVQRQEPDANLRTFFNLDVLVRILETAATGREPTNRRRRTKDATTARDLLCEAVHHCLAFVVVLVCLFTQTIDLM
jgi:hypothetical protein